MFQVLKPVKCENTCTVSLPSSLVLLPVRSQQTLLKHYGVGTAIDHVFFLTKRHIEDNVVSCHPPLVFGGNRSQMFCREQWLQ